MASGREAMAGNDPCTPWKAGAWLKVVRGRLRQIV